MNEAGDERDVMDALPAGRPVWVCEAGGRRTQLWCMELGSNKLADFRATEDGRLIPLDDVEGFLLET